MKKALALILAAAMACSLVLTGCGGGTSATGSASTGAAAGAKSLTLATGGTTGTYYAVGGVMSTVLNKKLTNSSLTVTSTGASKANIQLIADGEADLGIAICGTGVGISLAANKVKGIRACVCSEPYTAKLSRMHNNSNILAFGARVVGSELAKMIVDEWLNASFEGGRHQRRVDMIMDIENK